MTQQTPDPAAIRAALDRLAATVAGMTPGEWYADPKRSSEGRWFVRPGSRNAFPNVSVDVHSAPGGHGADAAGIAALRNAAEVLIAVARAAAEHVAASEALTDDDGYTSAEIDARFNRAQDDLDAALAALAAAVPGAGDGGG